MKIAIFADIHGNYEALTSIYDSIKKDHVDEIIYLGDVIGIGPQPIKCLDFIMNHPDIKMVLGNHEERQLKECNFDFYAEGNRHHLWVHERLNETHMDYINNLPIFIEREVNNKKLFFGHFFLKSLKHNDLFYPIEVMDDKELTKKIRSKFDYDYMFMGHNHVNYDYSDLSVLDVGTSGCVYDDKTSYYIVNIDNDIKLEKKIITFDRESFEKSFIDFDNEHNLAYRFFGVKYE